MVALSTQGRHLFAFCRYMGWLPPVKRSPGLKVEVTQAWLTFFPAVAPRLTIRTG